MITGMTGFGAGEVSLGKIKGVVEIKTVNHRYLDVAFYLPSGFSAYEEKIQKIIANHIKRGRITVSIKITDKPHMTVVLNKDMVGKYIDFARSLGKSHGLRNDLGVSDIMRLPGVVEAKEVFVDASTMWPAVEKAMVRSVRSVVAMRQREGRAVAADINDKLKKMSAQISLVKNRSAELLKEKKKVLGRDEFSAFQKSNDVNEELARLSHYIDEARALLSTRDGAGKKLDFIAQEMQRETNTIGSKVQDKTVAGAVIALKSKVEKIREQANNVE